ncbi:hypothetical protein [Pontibacillus yanchengensis]|uniref:Uncharacterized protein n=1 Tax=Pontibacillus yanchengensis Y32 TaxID=1385514 RepID=A0A0A2TKQ1_9BACI|nr:hypothetical protein [Pontibacillus yanchengensis]KGP74656.1 hypothetical protein N782_00065 [Pontibacillus yanchengensis Y32]
MEIASIKSNYIKNQVSIKSTNESNWKSTLDDTMRAVNPLHDLNMKHNNLISSAVGSNDWSKYNEFKAKQNPAWYDLQNGSFTENKTYWGNMFEERMEALKEARHEDNQKEIHIWSKRVNEAVEGFKKAPGVTPYVVGLNSLESFAKEYEVDQASEGWFDSKWNNPKVLNEGQFEDNEWYKNAYMKENPELARKAIAAAKAYREPEIAKVASIMEEDMNTFFAQQSNSVSKVVSQDKEENNVSIINTESKEYVNQLSKNHIDNIQYPAQMSFLKDYTSYSHVGNELVEKLYWKA